MMPTSYERQSKIVELLKTKKFTSVEFLCQRVYASGATIRRDLNALAERGIIQRVRGGAILPDGSNQDLPRIIRENRNVEEKKHIAQLALPFIHDASTIFLDSSSTCVALAEKMDNFKKLSIVTNNIVAAQVLNENSSAMIYLCGGLIKNHTATVGLNAIMMVDQICADIMFFSCVGFSAEYGTTETNSEGAELKKTMLKNARRKILLCDSTKINQQYFYKCCPVNKIDVIITNKKPPDEFLRALPGSIKLVY
jgi:DeoR/GlpR family transcriptional regulator of sugar metabolism